MSLITAADIRVVRRCTLWQWMVCFEHITAAGNAPVGAVQVTLLAAVQLRLNLRSECALHGILAPA